MGFGGKLTSGEYIADQADRASFVQIAVDLIIDGKGGCLIAAAQDEYSLVSTQLEALSE